ncbi:uncharacterized protein LOC112351357 [Selaginella moellendorffii]|uniref:uncharacterized protein LOC112351357 n=1 Tax=Selaginella moellendorffii TaxID=88036 RepID=UPI000D1CE321|nr:uncharacterized protein LOC112351357 [Selaginella moellendorffii]XP_024544848.1 uncharacterized protein LOC112351357 [Selaginella moellendorffii]XP_024544849.1 uncharacterized protein LOC112351357 [Selaginella moellendorffii]|eukprot:XP_024544847.1 uncharacterized protein LOC112351357 [Selaginella moellendorffii]
MPRQYLAPPFFTKGSFYSVVIPAVLKNKRFTGRRRRGQAKDKMPSRYAVFSGVSPAAETHGSKSLENLRNKRMTFNKVVTDHIDHFSKEEKSPGLSRIMGSLLKDVRAKVNGPMELRRTEGVHSDLLKFLLNRKREDARRKILNS